MESATQPRSAGYLATIRYRDTGTEYEFHSRTDRDGYERVYRAGKWNALDLATGYRLGAEGICHRARFAGYVQMLAGSYPGGVDVRWAE